MSYVRHSSIRIAEDFDASLATLDNGRPFPNATDGAWHVLHTKARQEKAISNTLSAMGIAHFLPMTRQVRYYGRRKLAIDLPLFPSYVFLRGSRDDTFEADRTKRVAQIIPVVDQAKLDRELRNLHLALCGNAQLDPYPFLTKGAWVEVRSGPFRGLQGLIDERNSPDRLVLQVEMLGQSTSLEIDASLLEPIDPPRQ